jgi:hypothetical protein
MTQDFMPLPAMDSTATAVPPHILLGNHLKALKLPTFARDYEKVAMESAQDRADYPKYLLRLCELERIDRVCVVLQKCISRPVIVTGCG